MTLINKLKISSWLIVLGLLWPWPAQADEPARLFLQNLPLQDDRLLVVTLQLENVTDLYGAEIQIRYDPTQLNVRDEDPRLEGAQIAPGPLLAFDDRFVAANKVDSGVGLIDFVFTLLKPAPPINSNGVLATIVFEVIGQGPFAIEVAQAKLVSAKFEAISVNTAGLLLDKATSNEASVPPTGSWSGWLGAGLLALALGLIPLIWLLAKRLRLNGEPKPARRMLGGSGNAIHTAALLAEQGQQAVAQGDLAQAYDRFSQAIEFDPANVAAWLGKGQVAQQSTEKRICFQRVLALDPKNVLAQEAMGQLND
jgi:tetratricopeptide (TPR) repeat protein